MKSVRFSTQMESSELPGTIQQMARIVGWPVWRQRIESLKSDMSSNPYWEHFILERYGLELAYGDIRRYLKSTGRYPWPPRTAEEYRLYSFIAVVVRVYARLSPRGQANLSGALHSALEKEFGLGPRAFEMKIVAHLMNRGFEVTFHDYETGGGYDFLARREAVELEVECKHISADIGRQIHRGKLHRLGGVLYPIMSQAVDREQGGRFLRVTLPSKLTNNKEQMQAITDRVTAVLTGEVSEFRDEVCTISTTLFPLENSPFSDGQRHNLTMETAEHFLEQVFGIENPNVLLNGRPGRAAIIIYFQSERPDKVLGAIVKHLKADVKKQFSGNLPAFLCLHFADLTETQLLDLFHTIDAGKATGIDGAVKYLIHRRPNLHSVALMTDGEVRMTRKRSLTHRTTAVGGGEPSYVISNLSHPLADNLTLDQVFC